MNPGFGRVQLHPLSELDLQAWRRIQHHFRDPEIAFLNGTLPNRMPLWLLKRVLLADARRSDRQTFGIFDEHGSYIGTIELYDIHNTSATLGIIIGERSHWNRGYGPEAMTALLDFGFGELGLEQVRLTVYADNPRALASYRKVGFYETRRTPAKGGRTDVHMLLNKGAWFERRREQRYGAPGAASRAL
jgi:RimJ/RimL family protein N-acetyltransferase